MLSTRFERMGDLRDLQKAIKEAEERLAAMALDNPYRAAVQSILGNILYTRFERIGDLEDLQKAIRHGEEGLAATPPNHPDRAVMHTNLGVQLSKMFERMGNFGDLQRAIKHAEEALSATPQDHPARAWRHGSLGNILSARFEWKGDLGDLQKAINHCEEALAATPQDHPERAAWHNSLGVRLYRRFERIGDPGDLQKAIKHAEEALAATPPDHPDRAIVCGKLATFSTSNFLGNLHSLEDFNKSLRLYLEAYNCRTSSPRNRIQAARCAAALLYISGKFPESSSIFEDAVNLVPRVDLRFLMRDDQQHVLSQISGLASAAASLGRGIIMGFSIDARSEASDLKTDHPLVFDKFNRLRVEIDSEIDCMNCASDETLDQRRNRAVSRRYEAVNDMEQILNHIRSLPGYDGFLLPPSQDELMEMATSGPIVVFNSTSFRSDAIIVTKLDITALDLPKLSYDDTVSRMQQLASFGGGSFVKRGQDAKGMKDLLLWLWDVAVGPVFDHLEASPTYISDGDHKTNLKRIWWIGVGQLSMAPFHAAGDHSPGSTRNTISQAISSYIPTIKALSYARQKQLHLFEE
ncbi:unnamed protein product [Tuber aestivum]|uniref:CHAT domain-containing protein n=1 Tax=Tuber aestivum TaxID=59557 RepID=A0A292PQT5_9PEZI|nr:unnamed protein product [Tuber aestivum]